jgi:hypothetical protein
MLEELVIERVDKETEMKRMEEGSKGDEGEKKDGDHEMEEMEKSKWRKHWSRIKRFFLGH